MGRIESTVNKEWITEWLIKRAMFPLSVASTTTSSLILKSCTQETTHIKRKREPEKTFNHEQKGTRKKKRNKTTKNMGHKIKDDET